MPNSSLIQHSSLKKEIRFELFIQNTYPRPDSIEFNFVRAVTLAQGGSIGGNLNDSAIGEKHVHIDGGEEDQNASREVAGSSRRQVHGLPVGPGHREVPIERERDQNPRRHEQGDILNKRGELAEGDRRVKQIYVKQANEHAVQIPVEQREQIADRQAAQESERGVVPDAHADKDYEHVAQRAKDDETKVVDAQAQESKHFIQDFLFQFCCNRVLECYQKKKLKEAILFYF